MNKWRCSVGALKWGSVKNSNNKKDIAMDGSLLWDTEFKGKSKQENQQYLAVWNYLDETNKCRKQFMWM